MRILAAIDGSKFSELVTDAVIAQGKAVGTEVQVLHLLQPLPQLEDGVLKWEITTEQRKQGEALLMRASEKLAKAGIQCTTTVSEGVAKSVILDVAESWSADLILVGSHGDNWIERFFLGSVSEAVARHASCSVQIVRARKG
jgi:nucleotide-binding universal stress UspA family protein